MELQVLSWVVFSIMGLAMWFLKATITDTKEEIKNLKSELQNVKQDYLHKEDFREFKSELRGMFEDIKRDIRALNPHERS